MKKRILALIIISAIYINVLDVIFAQKKDEKANAKNIDVYYYRNDASYHGLGGDNGIGINWNTNKKRHLFSMGLNFPIFDLTAPNYGLNIKYAFFVSKYIRKMDLFLFYNSQLYPYKSFFINDTEYSKIIAWDVYNIGGVGFNFYLDKYKIYSLCYGVGIGSKTNWGGVWNNGLLFNSFIGFTYNYSLRRIATND